VAYQQERAGRCRLQVVADPVAIAVLPGRPLSWGNRHKEQVRLQQFLVPELSEIGRGDPGIASLYWDLHRCNIGRFWTDLRSGLISSGLAGSIF